MPFEALALCKVCHPLHAKLYVWVATNETFSTEPGESLTIENPAGLADLLRSINLRLTSQRPKGKPYCIVVPYAFIINGKPVEHTHPVWVDAADSFEDAKRQAVDRFLERVYEGVREGFDPIVQVYHNKIHRY